MGIQKIRLAESVIKEIKDMLLRDELSEGDKLPNQIEFASQLGVSRTVLREALQTLSDFGVVQQRPKIGTIIVSTAPLIYSKFLQSPLQEHP